MNCQRLHVRFVVQPARLSQPSVTPISSRDAQDHRGRSHRPCVLIVPNWPSQSWWPLVLWLIVRWALVYLPPKFCVLPCTRHKTDPFCHLRSQHHPTHCSGVQRHARVEVWKCGTRALLTQSSATSRPLFPVCAMRRICWLLDAAPTRGSAMRGSSNVGRISVRARGCDRFVRIRRMYSAIWIICRRKRCQSLQPTAVSFCHQLLARRHGPFQTGGWPSSQHAPSRVR